jgi:hypothetical protein
LVIHGHRERVRGGDAWEWSPHGHIIGWGWTYLSLLPKGWVLRVFGAVDSQATAERIVAYELDHCLVQTGRAAHTWFGSCAYNNIEMLYEKHLEQSTCKVCGAGEYAVERASGQRTERLEVVWAGKARFRASTARKRGGKRRRWGDLRTTPRARALCAPPHEWNPLYIPADI